MKRSVLISIIIAFLLGVVLTASGFFALKYIEKEPISPGNNRVYIGDVPISEYSIVAKPFTLKEGKELSDYVYKSTGHRLKVRFKAGEHNIFLSKKTESSVFHIENGDIYLVAKGDELSHLVGVCANSILGFSFAKEKREHLLYEDKSIYIPTELVLNDNTGWMPEREPIVCLWNPSMTRGAYYNPKTAKDVDILAYSDDDLYEYVKMMQHLGFTGIQVTDICAAWAEFGSYEFVQERLRFIADAAHSLGMKFTLWVWGSEFNGYGWNDKSVVYHGDTIYEIDLPEVTRTYDKYYDIYAELADCADRVIVHYFEPGNVFTMKNAGYFARKLYDRFVAVNPDVNFGINVYSNYFNIDELKESLSDLADKITYYTLDAIQMDDYLTARSTIRDNGLKYGIWSWGVIEREIDQTASLSVNSRVIKNTYLRTQQYDEIIKPDYWSEMDSYHILNVFSLYCSGKLLRDPSLDADALIDEAAKAVVGTEYSTEFSKVLRLLQKARGGNSIEEFAEGTNYLLSSDTYPAKEILAESEEAIRIIDNLLTIDGFKCSLPIPVDVHRILELMRPHLLQIHAFAGFRLEYEEICQAASDGATSEELQALVNKAAYKNIDEYNVVTGVWGINEQRVQFLMLDRFCENNGLSIPANTKVDHLMKQRIYGEFGSLQSTSDSMLTFKRAKGFQLGRPVSEARMKKLIDELIEEGFLSEYEDDPSKVYVTDWYKY